MFDSTDALTSSSSEQALAARIALQERQIVDALAPYDPTSAAYAWFDTLRAIEELINLLTVEWGDEGFGQALVSLPVIGLDRHLDRLTVVRQRILQKFGENFCIRFTRLLVQGSAISVAFAQHGIFEAAAGFQTIGTMMGYLQSRRRHFVGLLHMLPHACRGRQRVEPLDALNIFLPIIELSAVQMMGAQNALLVKMARAKLTLPDDESAELAMLDTLFLEPERVRITEMPMTEQGKIMFASMEALRPDRLFSAAELRNDVVAIEATYAEFDLKDTDFPAAAALVRRLSRDFVEHDFWVAISSADLGKLSDEVCASRALRSALINNEPSYTACLSTYAPFVLMDGAYRSTVTLLSRFIYNWRAQSLDRKKRFQIRAGFIFEKAVAVELQRQGFTVQDITRINHHEFDVVTVRDGVIWNVQCKNNFVDLSSVDSNAHRFARYNFRLVRAYERALVKEASREHLLKTKMSLNAIQHVVVSRFPVISDNPRIVPFSRIGKFSAVADVLEVATAAQG